MQLHKSLAVAVLAAGMISPSFAADPVKIGSPSMATRSAAARSN